jgi:hypothetical protein
MDKVENRELDDRSKDPSDVSIIPKSPNIGKDFLSVSAPKKKKHLNLEEKLKGYRLKDGQKESFLSAQNNEVTKINSEHTILVDSFQLKSNSSAFETYAGSEVDTNKANIVHVGSWVNSEEREEEELGEQNLSESFCSSLSGQDGDEVGLVDNFVVMTDSNEHDEQLVEETLDSSNTSVEEERGL